MGNLPASSKASIAAARGNLALPLAHATNRQLKINSKIQ
jgi:hypothetical protein